MTLTEQDRGHTIQVDTDSVVTLRLTENPTTGYRWTLETAPELEQIGDRFEAGGPAIGAGGVRVFEFRATRVGRHELRLKNWREWEGENSVIDRFDAKIDVK